MYSIKLCAYNHYCSFCLGVVPSCLHLVHHWVQVKTALQQAKGRPQKRQHRNVSPPHPVSAAKRAWLRRTAGVCWLLELECATIVTALRCLLLRHHLTILHLFLRCRTLTDLRMNDFTIKANPIKMLMIF